VVARIRREWNKIFFFFFFFFFPSCTCRYASSGSKSSSDRAAAVKRVKEVSEGASDVIEPPVAEKEAPITPELAFLEKLLQIPKPSGKYSMAGMATLQCLQYHVQVIVPSKSAF